MRAGQARRQLDFDEGGRGRVPAPGAAGAALRRRGDRHGLRRKRPGRHVRAQGRHLPPGLRAVDAAGRFSAGRHRLRPEHLRHRDRHRGAQQLRGRLHQCDALDQAASAARQGIGRRVQRQLFVPRQRPGARGDPHGFPLPRDQGGHDDGHRQRRAARRVRRHRSGASRARRGRRAQSQARRRRKPDRAPGHVRRDVQDRRQARRRRPGVARHRRRGAAVACAGQGHHDLHRRRYRGGATQDRGAGRQADPGDRGAADGRHERRRRPVRRRQDVPAAGREKRARDEAGGRPPDPVHRGGEGEVGRRRQAEGNDRDGDGQGRRPRHRQEHRRRRPPVQQFRRHRSGRHGAGAEDPRRRARAQRRSGRPVRADHAFARGNGARGARDAAARHVAAAADRRCDDLARAHRGQDRAELRRGHRLRARRLARGGCGQQPAVGRAQGRLRRRGRGRL